MKREPEPFVLAAFALFKELQQDCQDSDLPLFLENFKAELAAMKDYIDAHGCDERTAFEAVFCEQANPEPCNRIPLPEETNGIPLPTLATVEELQAQQRVFLEKSNYIDKDITPFVLDFSKAYEPPEYVYKLDDVGFAPLGGLQAVTGLSGNGKTQLVCQLVATALGGSFGRLHYALSKKPRLLLADTEQEISSVVAMKQRICSMIGANPQQQRDDFKILLLREVLTANERWLLILKACHDFRPDIIFVDGLLDLLGNFNDVEQCQQRIFELMAMATFYHASVWCVLHLNPNGAKLVGHAGSFLERKCTDLFACVKDKDSRTGEILFEVTQRKARSRDVPTWKFRVLNVTPWGLPEMIIDTPTGDEIPIEDIEAWLRADKDNIEQPATLEAYKDIFRQRGHIKASDTLQECVTRARNKRLVIPQEKSEYEPGQKHPKFYLNLNQ